jgi:hypothetical protein
MFLADKFIERPRPHPSRERRSFVQGGKIDIFLFEKVLHEEKVTPGNRIAHLCCSHGGPLIGRATGAWLQRYQFKSETSRVRRRIT